MELCAVLIHGSPLKHAAWSPTVREKGGGGVAGWMLVHGSLLKHAAWSPMVRGNKVTRAFLLNFFPGGRLLRSRPTETSPRKHN